MSVSFTDNRRFFIDAKNEAVERALEAIGLQAEGDVAALAPHDTGLLRNSITHAVSGNRPAISSYTDDGGGQLGTYAGSVPDAPPKKKAVYVGTNVEYAPYQECGTIRTRPQPFLTPGIQGNISTYQEIAKSYLKG